MRLGDSEGSGVPLRELQIKSDVSATVENEAIATGWFPAVIAMEEGDSGRLAEP